MLGYLGKSVVVTGAGSGIGQAVRLIPDNLYAVFNNADNPGPPSSELDITLVNFVGHRSLTEALLPKMQDGGAVAF